MGVFPRNAHTAGRYMIGVHVNSFLVFDSNLRNSIELQADRKSFIGQNYDAERFPSRRR